VLAKVCRAHRVFGVVAMAERAGQKREGEDEMKETHSRRPQGEGWSCRSCTS
jgi:hypothetical protein